MQQRKTAEEWADDIRMKATRMESGFLRVSNDKVIAIIQQAMHQAAQEAFEEAAKLVAVEFKERPYKTTLDKMESILLKRARQLAVKEEE